MITLKELSKEAGVSISAVSKALNDSSDISEETKNRIVALARERGYSRKKHPSQISNSGRSMTIAIIYSDIVSNYYTKLLKEYDARISEMGAIMLMASAQFKTERIIELCSFFQQTGIADGIICISPFNIFGQIPPMDIPMIGISYPSTEYHAFDHLSVDDSVGIADGIAKLVELGHTKIAYMGEKYTWYRQQDFEAAMKSHKLKIDPAFDLVSDYRFEKAGYDCAERLLKHGDLPTAIFAAYDDIAAGAAETLKNAGYRIPEDISIAGIDYTQRNIGNGKVISSVNCHIKDQVNISLNLLLRKIRKQIPITTVQNINLRTEFMPTNSIGPVSESSR